MSILSSCETISLITLKKSDNKIFLMFFLTFFLFFLLLLTDLKAQVISAAIFVVSSVLSLFFLLFDADCSCFFSDFCLNLIMLIFFRRTTHLQDRMLNSKLRFSSIKLDPSNEMQKMSRLNISAIAELSKILLI